MSEAPLVCAFEGAGRMVLEVVGTAWLCADMLVEDAAVCPFTGTGESEESIWNKVSGLYTGEKLS